MRTAYIYNFLLEANIMASIAILLMLILRKTLRKQLGNGALCFGWLLVAVRLLCPITLPNPWIATIQSPYADAPLRPIAGQVKVRVADALMNMSSTVGQMAGSYNAAPARMLRELHYGMSNASLPISLMKLYIVGAVAVLVWFAVSNTVFRWRLRADRIEPISGKLLEQYLDLCRQRRVRPLPVYFTDPLPSACLVGVIRPYIALPLSATPQEAIHVLTHEVCHFRNRDHLWGVLRLSCCVLHWWNPLVWIAASVCRTDLELRCDDRVVEHMDRDQRKEYANVLVLAASRRTAPNVAVLATGMTMTGRRLLSRVRTVMQGKTSLRWLSVCFVVASSMCLVGAFATNTLDSDLLLEVNLHPMVMRAPKADDLLPEADMSADSKENAINYAKKLAETVPNFQVDLSSVRSWQVFYEDVNNSVLVVGEKDGNNNLDSFFEAHFFSNGAVGALRSNCPCDVLDRRLNTYPDVNRYMTEESYQSLLTFLRQWTAALNPTVSERMVYDVMTRVELVNGVSYYHIAFFVNESVYQQNGDVSAYFVVTLDDGDVSIREYNIFVGDLVSNG